jgi:hypothetical protein
MESVGHLENVTAIKYILWPIGKLVVISYIFPHFGTLCQEKSGNPDPLWPGKRSLSAAATQKKVFGKQNPIFVFCDVGMHVLLSTSKWNF